MLFDLHAHSSGISRCCLLPYSAIIDEAKAMGIHGLVLTNHYTKDYLDGGDASVLAHEYAEEYRRAKAYGESVGVTVLFGIEISAAKHNDFHLLFYGIEEDFIEAYPEIYNLTQEELYRLAEENGALLIQAHPFRGSTYPLDPAYLHGVEINCHPLYGTSRYDDVVAIAVAHKQILTCGGDYHADTYRPYCGVCLPDAVKTSRDLVTHLKQAKTLTIRMQEPADGQCYEVVYRRSNGHLQKNQIL
jgi:hypothetical protein